MPIFAQRVKGQLPRSVLTVLCVVIATGGATVFASARADGMPTFSIEFKDGMITPLHLEVPADHPFKLELHNTGNTPAEFESTELHLEKVLAAQSSSFLVVRRLAPGKHKFFDDFHPDAAQAVLIAR